MQAKQKFTLLTLATGILLAAPVVTYPQAARQKRKRADVIIIPGHPATATGKETPLLKPSWIRQLSYTVVVWHHIF